MFLGKVQAGVWKSEGERRVQIFLGLKKQRNGGKNFGALC